MTEHEQGRPSIAVLHRMISYIRDEALRLRLMDVAILLEQAEEAVTAFAPPAADARGGWSPVHDTDRVEH